MQASWLTRIILFRNYTESYCLIPALYTTIVYVAMVGCLKNNKRKKTNHTSFSFNFYDILFIAALTFGIGYCEALYVFIFSWPDFIAYGVRTL